MTVVWVDGQHHTNTAIHTGLYASAAVMSFLVYFLYLASGIHKKCSGSLIVNRVACDTFYFTAMVVASERGLGKQAYRDGTETMIFDHCEYTAPFAVFFRLASVLWFLIQIYDARSAMRTPFVFRNTAQTKMRYAGTVWGICGACVLFGFFPPNGGFHRVGNAWGANMEGDCGFAVWNDGFNPWVIVLQIAPYACAFLFAITTLRRAKMYLSLGCRRTRLVRNRELAKVTVQVATWSVYYGFGAVLVLVSQARWESGTQGDKYSYVWSDVGKSMAAAVISWRCLRAWLINPFLFVVDIGVFDGLMISHKDTVPREVASQALKKLVEKLKQCKCCTNVKSALLDAGSSESEAQLAAREDVVMCVMKGVVESTQRTAAIIKQDAPPCGNSPGEENTFLQKAAHDQIKRVQVGEESTKGKMLKVNSDGVNFSHGFTDPAESSAEPADSERQHDCSSESQPEMLTATKSIEMTAATKSDIVDSEWEGSRFYEHCPLVSHWIRHQLGIEASDYIASIKSNDGTILQMAEKFTEGRSNSFFYFTQDRRYMASDHAAIVSNMCNYAMYLEQTVDSLLNRIVGCYQLQFHPSETPIYVIVIVNIMWSPECHKPQLLFYFDLKGSTIERQEIKKEEELPALREMDSEGYGKQLKDSDLLNLEMKPTVSPEAFKKLREQLGQDVEWLRKNDIMDYSLLLAVGPRPKADELGQSHSSCLHAPGHETGLPNDPRFFCQSRGGIEGTIFGGRQVLIYIGIIDISQEYDFSKKGEAFLKTKLLCRDPKGISCCPVDQFAERYLETVGGYFHQQDDNDSTDHVGVEVAADVAAGVGFEMTQLNAAEPAAEEGALAEVLSADEVAVTGAVSEEEPDFENPLVPETQVDDKDLAEGVDGPGFVDPSSQL